MIAVDGSDAEPGSKLLFHQSFPARSLYTARGREGNGKTCDDPGCQDVSHPDRGRRNPHEWRLLVEERLVDFLRMHVSAMGGITPARNAAIFYDLFPGLPVVRKGYMYPNDKPGLGIDLDETLAAKYPCRDEVDRWTQTRLPDGSPARP
jgi:hypothetical protein